MSKDPRVNRAKELYRTYCIEQSRIPEDLVDEAVSREELSLEGEELIVSGFSSKRGAPYKKIFRVEEDKLRLISQLARSVNGEWVDEIYDSSNIIGYTRSGKAVYDGFNHVSHFSFTEEDHADAASAHAYLAGETELGPRGVRPKHSKSVVNGIKHEDMAGRAAIMPSNGVDHAITHGKRVVRGDFKK